MRIAFFPAKTQKVVGLNLPTLLDGRYRTALLRATIALAVGFALVARWAEAAEPEASPSADAAGAGIPAAEPAEADTSPAGTRPAPNVGALPDRPFDAESTDSGDEADAAGAEDEEPGAPLRALSCLEGEGGNDQDGARRGVQKRDFLKKYRVEIAALGGHYASDALSSTYVYGAALSFFFSEDFGVEAMVLRNPVAFRLEDPFRSFNLEQHFEPSVAWNLLGAMTWSPIHAKLRWSERHITHADLLLVAGGGRTLNDTAQGLTFQAGLGVKLYLARFVSLRIDVRDLIIPEEVLGRSRVTHNVVTMFGLCGWVPG
jgi:outer membrane beta-barrel protein